VDGALDDQIPPPDELLNKVELPTQTALAPVIALTEELTDKVNEDEPQVVV
jgi:hypothetical protein